MHRVLGPMAIVELAMLAGVGLLVALRHRKAVAAPLHWVTSGDTGRRYAFLHGLGATQRYWQVGLAGRKPSGRMMFADLMGFGDSPKPWFRHTVERHVERLHADLKDAGPVTLVGHSLGAALALAYAARHPGQVERLVLISLPYFGGQAAAYRWLRRTAEGWIFTNIALMTLACIVTRRLMSRWLPAILRHLPREVAEDVVRHSWAASTTSLWDVVYGHDLARDADALGERIPVACIHGADDLTVPPDAVRDLAANHRNWSLVVLSGTDHHPWLRNADVCQSLVFDAVQSSGTGLASASDSR